MSDKKRGGGPVDVAQVVAALQDPATAARIAREIAARHPVRYQAAPGRPGLLERVDADGVKVVGAWRGGRFVASGE